MRRRLWAGIAAVWIVATHSWAQVPAPACLAEADTLPSSPVVGQQVLYRVRIFRREDISQVKWVHPPAFPNLRVEWLPGRAEDTETSIHGSLYRVSEEHRALFPARAGHLTLPGFELRCDTSSLPVPETTLDVREPPTQGRPPDFDGIIGPLQVQARAKRLEIRLGETVRISVVVRGASNVWDVEPPFGDLEPKGRYEIFPQRPELHLETGRQLYIRRYFRFDFVPHEVGTLEIPAVAIPYYDPTTRQFSRARSEPIVVSVTSLGAAPATGTRNNPEHPSETSSETPPRWLGLAAVLAAVGLLAGAAGWRHGRARRDRSIQLARALDAARAAEERGEAGARAAALVRALEIVAGSSARPGGGAIAEQRDRLEAIRFGGAGASESDTVWAEAEALISRLR
jgi:hypothetical protein